MPSSRPHANTYWVHPNRFLAGEYPGDIDTAEAKKKLIRLVDHGINTFVDLTGAKELSPYDPILREIARERRVDLEYRRMPIRDISIPNVPAEMIGILDTIDDALARGRSVYVHCWGGVGRTGTVIGCHLTRRGFSGEEALERLAELWPQMEKSRERPHTPETEEQRAYIREWTESRAQAVAPAGIKLRRVTPVYRRNPEHFRGCLLGGAVGDALGAPIEFLSLMEIRARFGEDGIGDYAPAYGRAGAITDDTQMTLFTAEGLLRAVTRGNLRGVCHPPTVVHHAYLRWLHTQGEATQSHWPSTWKRGQPDGWLVSLPALHSRRAPGKTCISALQQEEFGTPELPTNDSKGCGGVMRAAPIGLLIDIDAFTFGCEAAAITHGHPTGFLAAGFLAHLIREIIEGRSLLEGIGSALHILRHQPRHEETATAVDRAIAAAYSRPTNAETVESLGGGWIAEEALAISLFCALVAEGDFERGLRLAVNHGGDSDSTGAITGNILGALLGESAIPQRWVSNLELRPEIESVADDLLTGFSEDEAWVERYPGW